jgi:hypothetical protein
MTNGPEDRVRTWRDGTLPTAEQKAQFSADQWRQFSDDSVIRDLSEIEDLPEPARSWARQTVQEARSRTSDRAASREAREAS